MVYSYDIRTRTNAILGVVLVNEDKVVRYSFFICDVCYSILACKGAVCPECKRVPKTNMKYMAKKVRR